MIASRANKIKYARKHAMTHMLVKDPDQKEKEYISLLEDVKNIPCGIGTTCYFSLMKHMAVLFGILTFICIGYCLIFNFLDTSKNDDPADAIISTGLGNAVIPLIGVTPVDGRDPPYPRVNDLYYYILVPELVFCIVYYVFWIIMKRNLNKTASEADDGYITPGDYGLMVSNIPKDLKDASVLYQHFEKLGKGGVHSVLLCYDVRELAATQLELDEAVFQLRLAKYSKDEEKNADLLDNLNEPDNVTEEDRIVDLSEYENVQSGCWAKLLRLIGFKKDEFYWATVIKGLLETRDADPKNNPALCPTTGFAFVMLNLAKEAETIADQYRKETKKNIFSKISSQPPDLKLEGEHPLEVILNLEPSDIQYQCLGVSALQIFFTKLATDAITVVLIAIGVVAMVFLNQVKGAGANTYVSIAISVIITIITSIISFVVNMLSHFTKLTTFTKNVLSKLFRLWFAAFILGSLASMMVSIFYPWSSRSGVFPLDEYPGAEFHRETRYILSRGWFEDIGFGLFTNIIVDVVKTSLLELTHAIEIAMLLYYVIFANSLDQCEINNAFAATPWPLEGRMAHMIKTVLMGLVVTPILPVTAPIIALYFFIQYWVDKFNLLRWYRAPAQYSNLLVLSVQDNLLNGFHIHCIVLILYHVFLIMVNRPVLGWDRHYIPVIIFAGLYGLFLIYRAGTMVVKICKRGCVSEEEARFFLDDDDETLGIPFEAYEEKLETFMDRWPLYRADMNDGVPSLSSTTCSNSSRDTPTATSPFNSTSPSSVKLKPPPKLTKAEKKARNLRNALVTLEDGSQGYDTRPNPNFHYCSYIHHGTTEYKRDINAQKMSTVARPLAEEYKQRWEERVNRKSAADKSGGDNGGGKGEPVVAGTGTGRGKETGGDVGVVTGTGTGTGTGRGRGKDTDGDVGIVTGTGTGTGIVRGRRVVPDFDKYTEEEEEDVKHEGEEI